MELRFDGRVAIVTGSSQGIGKGIAELLAARGAKVVISSRTAGMLEEVAAGIRANGGEVTVATGDLSRQEDCEAVVARAIEAYGQIDILVNNAGVSDRKPFEEMSADDFHRIIALNLDSCLYMTKAVWPHMTARGYGRIVNTASTTGMFGTQNNVHYGASKGGVHGLMRALAHDTPKYGIMINNITPMAATRLANNIEEGAFKDEFFAALPPERCAPIVGWLAHENCSVNGEVFDVGGGAVSRIFVAMTPGYMNPEATIEDIDAHIGEIMDETGYWVPMHAEHCGARVLERVREWNKARGR